MLSTQQKSPQSSPPRAPAHGILRVLRLDDSSFRSDTVTVYEWADGKVSFHLTGDNVHSTIFLNRTRVGRLLTWLGIVPEPAPSEAEQEATLAAIREADGADQAEALVS